MNSPSITVIDPGMGQMRQAARSFAAADQLNHYVSGLRLSQANSALLRALPGVSRLARRRALLEGIPADRYRSAGVLEDCLRAGLIRLPHSARPYSKSVAEWARLRRNARLAKRGAQHLGHGSAVFGTAGCSLEALQAAKGLDGTSALDFPIAHHRFSRTILAEEAELVPEFRGTLQFDRLSRYEKDRFDAEIDAADAVTVPSAFVKESFTTSGVASEKLVVSPYGVDLQRFPEREHRSASGFRVLFVGQIGQRKGISYLLDAYQQFQKDDTELVLTGLIVGDPSPLTRRGDLFQHIPSRPHEEIPDLMRSADVLVLPSLVEGMALVVLEAMASGVPVIVSTNTGAADVVSEGIEGFVVPIRDSETIAEKLEYLYKHPNERASMGHRARLQAERLTWDRYADSIGRLLNRDNAAISDVEVLAANG